MANPIIGSITVTPPTINPGGAADIRVVASDPDSGSVAVTVKVTDAAGNQTTGAATIPVSDPLTYVVTVNRGRVTQDAIDPALWHFLDA